MEQTEKSLPSKPRVLRAKELLELLEKSTKTCWLIDVVGHDDVYFEFSSPEDGLIWLIQKHVDSLATTSYNPVFGPSLSCIEKATTPLRVVAKDGLCELVQSVLGGDWVPYVHDPSEAYCDGVIMEK